jgi:hypothetical protein
VPGDIPATVVAVVAVVVVVAVDAKAKARDSNEVASAPRTR